MKNIIFDKDMNQAIFDERVDNIEYQTTTLYFTVPKNWLDESYKDCVAAEISIEYPIAHPEAVYATVMISPIRENSDGSFEDYDWIEVGATTTEIEALMILAKKESERYSNGRNFAP